MAVVTQRKSSIDRGIGTSPLVGGLRGSSATGRGWWTVEKKDDRGNPKVRGGGKALEPAGGVRA